MPHNGLMSETNILTLHAHVDSASADCDGPMYRDYVVGISDEEKAEHIAADGVNDFSEIHFRERVLASQVPVYAVEEGQDVSVTIAAWGFRWSQPTDEGYRSGEVRWCDDESCDPESHGQRDVYAEMMGY